MTQEEILEGNKLILNFMNVRPKSVISNIYYWNDAPFYYTSEDTEEKVMRNIVGYSKYHSSWDWLMPVYTKINKYIIEKCLTDFVFAKETEELHLNLWISLEDYSDTPIALWKSIIKYIKWYNQQSKS